MGQSVMAYADLTFYRNTYQGRTEADDETLNKWLSRASDDIDLQTHFSIDPAALTPLQTKILSIATCAQAEEYIVNGDGMDYSGSFSIGSFSMSDKGKSSSPMCEKAMRLLVETGLLYRGVSCGRFRG
jgi:hypothetical protein